MCKAIVFYNGPNSALWIYSRTNFNLHSENDNIHFVDALDLYAGVVCD
jgi:hypothetical protein